MENDQMEYDQIIEMSNTWEVHKRGWSLIKPEYDQIEFDQMNVEKIGN